jgi:vacuolar iron transporter family protein
MAKDALTARARDELGISEITTPRPVQAALTSALSFSVGAAMPSCSWLSYRPLVRLSRPWPPSLAFLALLGAIGGRTGGANVLRATPE